VKTFEVLIRELSTDDIHTVMGEGKQWTERMANQRVNLVEINMDHMKYYTEIREKDEQCH
jgi:hypothetical protein